MKFVFDDLDWWWPIQVSKADASEIEIASISLEVLYFCVSVCVNSPDLEFGASNFF